MIDLIFANDHDIVTNISHLPPFGMSHHSVLLFNLNVHTSIQSSTKQDVYKFQVNKGLYDDFRSHLQKVNWVKGTEDVEVIWENFNHEMNIGVSKFIPKKLIKHGEKAKKRYVPSTPGLIHKMHLKRVAFKTYKKHPTKNNYNTYCKYRNQVKWESRKSVRAKEQNIAKLIKTNPKLFYQYVSSTSKPREQISNLMKPDRTLTENDLEKAEVLKTFFHSVFYY